MAQVNFQWIYSIGIIALLALTLGNPVSANTEAAEGEGNHTESHGIHIVSWRFDELYGPVIISIFMLAVSILKVVFHHAECLSTVLPESCLLIIFGVIVGAILQYSAPESIGLSRRTADVVTTPAPPNGHSTLHAEQDFTPGIDSPELKLTAPLFLNFLLPPIVLDSAYSLNDRVFFNNLGTILLYAVVGTLMNFFLIGPSLYGLSVVGAMGDLEIGFVQALLFASFIVAVDPVAVLAIFQEIGVNNMLYFLVFGESLLNDAVTVVIYNMMKIFNEMETIPASEIGLGLVVFFCDSVGSLVIGIIFGVFTALLTKVTSHVRIVEPIVMIVMAYLSYMAAELIHWSGIISMIGCGLVQAQYAHQNISRKSLTTVKFFIKMLASTSDAVIFLFLGLEVVSQHHEWNTEFVLWSLALCLIFRWISVVLLTFISSKAVKRVEKIGMREQFIMWYGGLRGAVCFALCTTLPSTFKYRQMYLTATLVIIFFTVFIQGITIKPLVSLCRIKRKEEKTTSVASEFNTHVTDHVMAGVEVIVGQFFGDNYIRAWVQRMNDQYLKRWLQRNPMTHNEQILQFYQKIAIKDHVNHIYDATAKQVKVGDIDKAGEDQQDIQESDNEPVILPSDGDFEKELEKHQEVANRWRRMSRKRTTTDEDITISELQNALAKTAISTIHQTYDPNLTHDDQTDLLGQLKAKHQMLKENRERRAQGNSRNNSLRRRKMSKVSYGYESNTDHESRPVSAVTAQHEGYDNFSFVNEDGNLDRHDSTKDNLQHIKMDEMNDKNKNRYERRRSSAAAPPAAPPEPQSNGTVFHVYADGGSNLNQNNNSSIPYSYPYDYAIGRGQNGIIPNQRPRGISHVSTISGNHVGDHMMYLHPENDEENFLPGVKINSNGHIMRQDIDPAYEEVTSL